MRVRVGHWASMITAGVLGSGVLLESVAPRAIAAETIQDPPAADETAAREEILQSIAWRRAMFEVNEWLTHQQVYTPQQVEEMRGEFRQRVADMNAEELKLLLGDLETKLQILDSPQVRDARAWMAEYVAVLSTRRRAEVLRDLPNLARLTPGQLHQEVVRIKQKRQSLESRQGAFGSSQGRRVASQVQSNQAAQRNLDRGRSSRPATFSPYRSQSNVNDRLNDAPNNRPTFFVDTWGGVGRTLPSSW